MSELTVEVPPYVWSQLNEAVSVAAGLYQTPEQRYREIFLQLIVAPGYDYHGAAADAEVIVELELDLHPSQRRK